MFYLAQQKMLIDTQKNLAWTRQVISKGLEKYYDKTAKLLMMTFACCSTFYLFHERNPVGPLVQWQG